MSWLSQKTGVHLNLRPLAPVAGGILGSILLPGVGTALGTAIGAGAAGTADSLAHRENIGQALGHGALDAGLAYGGAKIMGAMGYGRDAAGQASSTPASAGGGTAATVGTTGTNAAVQAAGSQAAKSGGLSLADKLAIGSTALQGIGGIAGGIAQGQQQQLAQNAFNQYSPLRQSAIAALQGSVAGGPRPAFQPQSPFAGMAPQGPPMGGVPPVGLPQQRPPMMGGDPNAQWAAILRARGMGGGMPGAQPPRGY